MEQSKNFNKLKDNLNKYQREFMKLKNTITEVKNLLKESTETRSSKKKKIILPSMSIVFKSFIIHRTVDLTKKWTDNTKKSETSSSPPPDTYLY